MHFQPWQAFIDVAGQLYPMERNLPLHKRVAAERRRITGFDFTHAANYRKHLHRLETEYLWIKAGRPYYNVHPTLVSGLCRTNLDVIPSHLLEVPGQFAAVNVRFAEHHDEIGGMRSVLFARNEIKYTLFTELPFREKVTVDGRVADVTKCITVEWSAREGETIPESFYRMLGDLERRTVNEGDNGTSLEFVEALHFKDRLLNCLRLLATVGFLANSHDELLQREVLNRDQRAYDQAVAGGNVRRQEQIAKRAHRRGKVGWNVGTNEMAVGERPPRPGSQSGDGSRTHKWAHIRSGHPHAVRYGPGRSQVKIKWFRPTVVRSDLPFQPGETGAQS